MKPRLTSPALSIPGAFESLQALSKAATDAGTQAGLPQNTIDLVSLRASQINGCAVCLDMHARALKKRGETDERLATLAAWRETPYFSQAERAALALAEAATRMSDRANPVPDEIWDEAARHFEQPALAALVVTIAAINTWNRLNVTTGQITGEWTAQWVG
jgi:AhpD family alkylhydroperoxidase